MGETGLHTMLSLLLFKTSPPSKVFVLLQNQKASSQPSEPMGGKGSPSAANKKAGSAMLFWLWTSPEAISAFCLCCVSVLHMSPALPFSQPAPTLHKHAAQELIPLPYFQWVSLAKEWFQFHSNSVAGGSLYCSEHSNTNLSACSAVTCNHHTHTPRRRERTGRTHWVANYRV